MQFYSGENYSLFLIDLYSKIKLKSTCQIGTVKHFLFWTFYRSTTLDLRSVVVELLAVKITD
ncbi:hypothetical protein BpHYR1_052174 [Brachionus plicatilis]|uniref:Uncharacterized protein n=1 Tax=Brachionus plicatilis TaxID=10195 RepID=A0A3M7QLJ6_BRAPC|nr:hypothetical protein BpHYR1_052174 [Brachionus plicatilis]